jgi:2-polyprenyl-6-methoxyphenol hydroxylase-like FAD-dependent oxidoreductase
MHTDTNLVGRVLVVGASMAGLFAAAGVAPLARSVLVLDRDVLPSRPAPRKGVPQGRHIHALLGAGRHALDSLLPGCADGLIAAGALEGDVGRVSRWILGGNRFLSVDADVPAIACTRPLLEHHLRAAVSALPNVEIVDTTQVVDYVLGDRNQVTGAVVIAKDDGAPRTLSADLVVDATGRASATPRWLADHGFGEPETEELEVNLGYVTRFFVPATKAGVPHAIIVGPTPGIVRNGVAEVVEGGRMQVTLADYGGRPPDDLGRFLGFGASLARPDIMQVLASATPLGDATSYAFASNRRVRFERVRRFPEGLLVLGDAVCSLNPVYAQGMSVAAREALLLRDCLTHGVDGLTRRYFGRVAKVVDGPWLIATGADRYLGCGAGEPPRSVRFANGWIARVQKAASVDPQVAAASLRVMNLVAAPSSLFSPRMLWRVLRANRRAGVGPVTRGTALDASSAT